MKTFNKIDTIGHLASSDRKPTETGLRQENGSFSAVQISKVRQMGEGD